MPLKISRIIYDFYGNPPKTKHDLRDYLISLQNRQWYTVILLFKKKDFGFNQHSVFRSLLTNEYVWCIFEDFDLELFPKKRFSTYDSMLENVINDYYIAWKLKD